MSEDITEAEIMGNAPSPPVFVAYGLHDTEHTFATIGAWQAFMDRGIKAWCPEDDARLQYPGQLRAFFDRNESVMDALRQQPQHRKAVDVIQAQFTRALKED